MSWQRSAGVLLHPTCLGSPYGIGDLGPATAAYLEWLASAGAGWWQVLPLNPPGPGGSPYQTTSSFAGNTLLISPIAMVENQLLDEDDLAGAPSFPEHTVDLGAVIPWKERLLRLAFHRAQTAPPAFLEQELGELRRQQAHWLPDFALFSALKAAHHGAPWHQWPKDLARRRPAALAAWQRQHQEEVELAELCQLLFFRQWRAIRTFANDWGVRILGDLPIFVAHDSADVWAHQELFELDEAGQPSVVAGVPPDYFSATGQRWGNPLYRWQRMADDGYQWWVDRLRHALALVDAVRLDHFRGFAAYWEIPAAEETAVNGRWVPGPGKELFDAVAGALGSLPLVAEDLGLITEDVHQLRRQLGLPGMAVLQFAFHPEPRSSFIPYALERDQVVYTGTHDNNTTVGWFFEDASEGEKQLLARYVGEDLHEVHWQLSRLALASVAETAILPHQDLAGLGGDCRMNRPGTTDGNWCFRITPPMLDSGIQDRLAGLLEVYGRANRRAGDGEKPAGSVTLEP